MDIRGSFYLACSHSPIAPFRTLARWLRPQLPDVITSDELKPLKGQSLYHRRMVAYRIEGTRDYAAWDHSVLPNGDSVSAGKHSFIFSQAPLAKVLQVMQAREEHYIGSGAWAVSDVQNGSSGVRATARRFGIRLDVPEVSHMPVVCSIS